MLVQSEVTHASKTTCEGGSNKERYAVKVAADACFVELLEVCLDNVRIIFGRLVLLLPFFIAFEFVEFGCCCSPILVSDRLIEISVFCRGKLGKESVSPPSSEGTAPVFGFLHLPISSVCLDFLQE
jgi:hypothetical protein